MIIDLKKFCQGAILGGFILGLSFGFNNIQPQTNVSAVGALNCGELCGQVDCPVGFHESFCHPTENCRCVCNPASNSDLSNPWCDDDTYQYVCTGGSKTADPGGSVSGVDKNCSGDPDPTSTPTQKPKPTPTPDCTPVLEYKSNQTKRHKGERYPPNQVYIHD